MLVNDRNVKKFVTVVAALCFDRKN